MRIQINGNARSIIEMLETHGFVAFCVGGCVRVAVMGIEPHDWDLATNARPEQVMEIFSHVIPTGIQHGTVTIMIDGENFEVTTFRVDGFSTDGRHPDSVRFSMNILEDISRRDFTFNAMFCDSDGVVQDEFGGIEDINNRIVRFIGNPDERIQEDSLRMMRAIRFATRFDFGVANDSRLAIIRNADLINRVSAERIRDEIVKTIGNEFAEVGVRMWHETGLLAHIVPAVDACFGVAQNNPHHIFDVGNHIAESVGSEFTHDANDIRISLAMFLHDIGKVSTKTTDDNGIDHFIGHGEVSAQMARDIMHSLKFDNDTIETVHTLILHHNAQIMPTGRSVRRWLNKVGKKNFEMLLNIRLADADAQNPMDFGETMDEVNAIWEVFNRVIVSQNAFTIKDLAINGRDLIEIGVPQDRCMGIILNALLDMVIENPELNERNILYDIV